MLGSFIFLFKGPLSVLPGAQLSLCLAFPGPPLSYFLIPARLELRKGGCWFVRFSSRICRERTAHARSGQVKQELVGQQLAVAPRRGVGRSFSVEKPLSSEHPGQFRVIHARHARGSWFLKPVSTFCLVVGAFLVSRALSRVSHLT